MYYTYINYHDNRKIVFEVITDGGIAEADKLFEAKIGKHPRILNYIGVFWKAT